MEGLLARKKLFLTVAIASAVLGTVSIAGIIFFILKLSYIPMALCITVTAHGFYGCPFYFMEYANLSKCQDILAEINEGEEDLGVIAERVGIRVEFADKLIKKCISLRYVEHF